MILKSIGNKAASLIVAMAAVCAGCHSDAPSLPDYPAVEEPEEPGPDQLTLCLNVSFDASGFATRAEGDLEEDDPNADTTDPNAPDRYDDPSGEFEKISTLRVIIVRQPSVTEVDGVEQTTGIVEANRLVATNDAGRPIYDNLEFTVVANEQKRIYLVANEGFLGAPTGFNGSATNYLDTFVPTKKGEDPKTISLVGLENWTVSLPDLTATTTQVTKGLFSPSTSRRLPLTEYFDVEVNRDEEYPADFCYSHLFLTRAAAKAVFYLNTSDLFTGDNVRNTYITAISLSGVGTTEYVFPYKAEYNPSKSDLISVTDTDISSSAARKEMYIKDFAVPADNREVTYLLDNLYEEIKQPVNGPKRLNEMPIYFPESILKEGEHYKVGVRLDNGTWLYADLTADNERHNILDINGRDAVARNTYLPIELKFSGAMDLTVNVLPWQREDHYVDFTANVGITDEHCLRIEGTPGQTGDYLELDQLAAQLVLNYGKVATGKFTIDSPLGYTWDAYLITTGGTQDAIQFQIPDPTDNTKTITTTHISGEIGKEAVFGIVSTVAPGPEQNSAQLIVMATLATGTQVIVDVLKNWPSGNPGILTVIQNEI